MKKVLLLMGVLLLAFMGCSSDNEVEITENEVEATESDYDPTYEVSFYDQDPGTNMKLGYLVGNEFLELIPQSQPPYVLLVQWSDEKGKKAIDNILEKYPDVMSKLSDGVNNGYKISSKKYFESPHFFVSSSYKEGKYVTLDSYNVRLAPEMVIKMKEGKSVEAIERDYANVMTFSKDLSIAKFEIRRNTYLFHCNLKTSHEVLQLSTELYQRDDVEYAEPNCYGWYCYAESQP